MQVGHLVGHYIAISASATKSISFFFSSSGIATKEGEVRFKEKEDDDWTKVVVGVGFVYISHNRVIMLVDTAERPEDIDRVRAEAALERAKEQLRQKQSIQEYHVSQASMARAMLRLKEAGKYEVK